MLRKKASKRASVIISGIKIDVSMMSSGSHQAQLLPCGKVSGINVKLIKDMMDFLQIVLSITHVCG